jgi:hypothetical protein
VRVQVSVLEQAQVQVLASAQALGLVPVSE